MAAINANMNDSIGWVPLSEADATNIKPGSYTIGSENVEIGGPHPIVPSRHDSPLNGRWVQRARAGSTAAAHLSGAALTRYYADAPGTGGSGGVTVDNTVDPPASISTMTVPGAVIAGSDADLTSIVTIFQRTVTLTDAQIRAMIPTPITVVPAQADRIVMPILAIVRSDLTAPYTLSNSNAIEIGLLEGFGDVVYNVPADLLTNDGYVSWSPLQFDIATPAAYIGTAGQTVNQPVEVGGGPVISGGGDTANTLTVTVWYAIVDLA